jgi:hypothetical protein
VLLLFASSTEGARAPIIGPDEASNTGNVLLTRGTLVDQRAVEVPWAADPAPAWVATFRSLRYEGTLTNSIPRVEQRPVPYLLQIVPIARGAGWVRSMVSFVQGGLSGMPPTTGSSESMSGPSRFGGLWVPPEGLARLRPGQELDRDPITHVVTSVEKTSPGPGGTEMMIISQSGPAQQMEFGYNLRNGMLVYMNRRDRLPHATMQTRVELKSVEYSEMTGEQPPEGGVLRQNL